VAPGITYTFRTLPGPIRVHILRADLEHPAVRFRAAIAQDREGPFFETTSSMGKRLGATAAVNADYFGPGHHNVEELLYIDGRKTYEPPNPFRSIINITSGNEVHIGMDRAGVRFYNTLGGGPHFVKRKRYVWDTSVAGKINGEGFSTGSFSGKNPWTAVGLTGDGRTLILAVADGRQPGFSIGVTPEEMAGILIDEGAYEAMRFDGGGSSTLWLESRGVVNSPSDGSERAVGTALLIYSDSLRRFIRGDANGDGEINIADALLILYSLFGEGDLLICPDAADLDDSESISLTDIILALEYLFRGGSPPPYPFPRCGTDRSGTTLWCARPSCE